MRIGAPLSAVVDLVLPPRCPGCGAVTIADHRFCATCWSALVFLGPPWCAACALPFDHDRGEGALCGACLADPPSHQGARAAVAYGAIARAVVLRLKYGGRTGLAETVAQAMARLIPAEATLLVPVPLHRWRLWRRGYNQAALIADALARERPGLARADLLVRTRPTPVLKGLGRKGRAKAVRGAFALAGGAEVRGARIVLVDDVYTTGATADACARVLRRAGAAQVTVLAWARVVGEGADD